jgi:hypothetical protein
MPKPAATTYVTQSVLEPGGNKMLVVNDESAPMPPTG